MGKLRRISLFFGALLISFSLASPAFAQSGEAQVRVAHLASDAPNVDVYVNDAPVSALTNVPFGTISPYLPLPAGAQNVKVYATGDTSAPVIEADVELADGGVYTVGAVGLVSDESLTAQVYEDDLSTPASGSGNLRVIHASPDAGPVDIVPEGGEALVSDLQFPDASPYAEVPADTYTINVNAAGTDETAIQVPDVPVADGSIYTAYAVGTAAAGDLQVLLSEDIASTTDGATVPDTGGVSPVLLAGVASIAAAVLLAGTLLAKRRLS